MEIGIDSFVATRPNQDDVRAVADLLDRIVLADEVGLDLFALGEHHRSDFLDSAAHMYLAAAAARTKRIKLGSAVTVVSASPAPISAFMASRPSALTSTAQTRAPSLMNSSTAARPMPEAPAVMTASFPLSLMRLVPQLA